MIVKQIIELPVVEYKPVVDELVRTVEATLPDSINGMKIYTLIDFYTGITDLNHLIVKFYIHIEGKIPNCEGVEHLVKQRFCVDVDVESFRLDDNNYIEFEKKNLTSILANVIIHMVRFTKTGEVEVNETTGGLKYLF